MVFKPCHTQRIQNPQMVISIKNIIGRVRIGEHLPPYPITINLRLFKLKWEDVAGILYFAIPEKKF